MRTLLLEVCIKIRNKWFFISALLTTAALWMGMGSESSFIINGAQPDSHRLIELSFTANLNLISLPFLSALPVSSSPRKELACGAARNILFRCGMQHYLFSRTAVLIVISTLTQFTGIMAFVSLLGAITGKMAFPVKLTLARLICSALFSLMGSFGAMLTRDSACAYVIPVAVCFSLSMLQSRFLIEAEYLDPLCWLSGSQTMLFLLSILFTAALCGYTAYLYREVKKNV